MMPSGGTVAAHQILNGKVGTIRSEAVLINDTLRTPL